MKKNTFIKVLSLAMAAGVILGSYGCKDSGNNEAEDTTAGTSASETTELTSVTTVIEYTSVDEKGKEKQATTVDTIVIPSINKAVLGPTVSEKISDDKTYKDSFKKRLDDYNTDEKQYEEIVNDAENWQTFSYDYYVSNPYAKRIAFREISSKSKDGILVDGNVGCEKSIPSGKGSYIIIEGMVDKNKYKDEAAIKKALEEMDLNIEYTFVESVDDTVEDWAKVDTKQLSIDISR